MTPTIRLATEKDTEQILAIYAPLVYHTNRSFEIEPPTLPEMAQRIARTLERMPWLSCEIDGAVAGYAYANPHRLRAAYQWSVEVSVYVAEAHLRQGIARALYSSLFALLRLQGFYNAYAGIALPNRPAISLHQSLGFKPVGTYEAVTYKAGSWHDVAWWQLSLQAHSSTPTPPASFAATRQSEGWSAALASGLPHLHVA